MRDNPGIDSASIVTCLEDQYGILVESIHFLPIGHDMSAFVYEVMASYGASYFLKIRRGPVNEPARRVTLALADHGIPHILAPVVTKDGRPWSHLDGEHTVVLYPFIRAENAMVTGLTESQWREFGATLRAIHDSGLGERFQGNVRGEDFALPSAALVRQMMDVARDGDVEGPAESRAAFWRENEGRIHRMLDRAETLGHALRSRPFEMVLVHTDIHAANILVGEDGRIWLVDWDGPMIAPRERDLLFVIGSRIARPVEPWEEDLFFVGYGPTIIDPEALVYYRYERIIEDIGEFARSVFLSPDTSQEWKNHEARLTMGLFAPDGDIDRAETVEWHW